VGLLGFWVVFIPFIGSIMQLFIPGAAVVLGFLGKKREPNGRGMAITGIILGFIGLAIAVLGFVFWVILAAGGAFDSAYNSY